MVSERASRYLDTMRALAALAVVVGHVRQLFFVYPAPFGSPDSFSRFIFTNTDLGQQAVMVFFVLSGYLISGTIFKSIRNGEFTWSTYLIARLTRLYVVLIPALLLGYFWDQLGMHLWGIHGVYSGLPTDIHILGFDVATRSTLRIMFFNALFLQQVHVPTFGSNGPLWSLAYEFWYYMIFPLGIMAIISKSVLKKALYALATLILCFLLPSSLIIYFVVWLFGAAIHFIPRITVRQHQVRSLLLCLSTAAMTGAALLHDSISGGKAFDVPADYLVGIAAAFCVYTISASANGRNEVKGIRKKSLSKEFAGFSYTLYLVHFPLLVFIHAAIYAHGGTKWYPTSRTDLLWGLIVALTLIYAWMIAYLTERRTNRIRKWVIDRYHQISMAWRFRALHSDRVDT